MYLPQQVKHEDGKAKWDAKLCLLEVTLPILRDEAFFHPSQLE